MYVYLKLKEKEAWYMLGVRHLLATGSHIVYHKRKAPAIKYKTGPVLWYLFGKLHRDFGRPAIAYKTGEVEYFLQGQKYGIKEEEAKVSRTDDNYINSIADNPAIVYKNGTKEWHFYGHLDRMNKPAVIYSNGDVEYRAFHNYYREDGPAVIIGNKQYWFKEGEFIKCIV